LFLAIAANIGQNNWSKSVIFNANLPVFNDGKGLSAGAEVCELLAS
jgi:hypothetical protein